MGNATTDATARVTGMSVPQPPSTPNQTPLTAPEPDQAQTAPSTLVQAQSAVPAQAALQTTGQGMSSAQTAARETAQANSRGTTSTLASSEPTSTSAPSVASPLTAIAITANGGASHADTGGSFEDAPTDLADTATAQTMPMEGEAATDIFGAPLPLEGRVTQASLQTGSSATLSTPATAPHLAAEISRKFEGKSAQFDISLTPEGLGKVDVKITINARGEVSAAMKFDNPQAAAELKGRAAELQRALEQSGFSLSQDGISFSDGQGQGFGAAQQQASQQDWQETARRTAQNRMFQDSNDLADAAALRVAEASSAYSRRSNTGVDVRI
jgi:Meckel syndrome type 1 protein